MGGAGVKDFGKKVYYRGLHIRQVIRHASKVFERTKLVIFQQIFQNFQHFFLKTSVKLHMFGPDLNRIFCTLSKLFLVLEITWSRKILGVVIVHFCPFLIFSILTKIYEVNKVCSEQKIAEKIPAFSQN